MKEFASVIVDVHHSNVDRVFDYAIPENMQVTVGSLVVVPFGAGDRFIEGYVVDLVPAYEAGFSVKEIRRVMEEEDALLPEQIRLAYQIKEKYACLLCQALSIMVPSNIRKGKARPKTIRVVKRACTLEEAEAILLTMTRAKTQKKVLELLTQVEIMALADLDKLIKGGAQAAKALEKKGLVIMEDIPVNRRPYHAMEVEQKSPYRPTPAQEKAIHRIQEALNEKKGQFLLFGVTGSGKTEIYIKIIEKVIAEGRQAIVLVPEISLTPLMTGRFIKRFGDLAAVTHSKMNRRERFNCWKRAK